MVDDLPPGNLRLKREIAATVKEQARQVFENISVLLEAGGATWADVVKVQIFLADFADFAANALLRIFSFDSPLLSKDLRQAIKQALLSFKYWMDEPGGEELLWMWNENHHINYHSAQYLAGQFFPDDTFTNTGFNATGGGIVNVCATADCNAGAPVVNTIDTTTGQVLIVHGGCGGERRLQR